MPKKDPNATAAAPTTRAKRVRRAVKPAAGRQRTADAPAPVTHDQIALRAYELHLAGTEGDALAHWLRAERELVTA
jgi:Protein of unknown function (DUF2934)